MPFDTQMSNDKWYSVGYLCVENDLRGCNLYTCISQVSNCILYNAIYHLTHVSNDILYDVIYHLTHVSNGILQDAIYHSTHVSNDILQNVRYHLTFEILRSLYINAGLYDGIGWCIHIFLTSSIQSCSEMTNHNKVSTTVNYILTYFHIHIPTPSCTKKRAVHVYIQKSPRARRNWSGQNRRS